MTNDVVPLTAADMADIAETSDGWIRMEPPTPDTALPQAGHVWAELHYGPDYSLTAWQAMPVEGELCTRCYRYYRDHDDAARERCRVTWQPMLAVSVKNYRGGDLADVLDGEIGRILRYTSGV